MRSGVAIANVLLGAVYTSYGILTIIDLKRGWRTLGWSHFGLAWIAMAFTCGPHHLEHGLHVALAGRAGGGLDLFAVLIGFPAGATWFLLRVEALAGGRGDRFVSGSPVWIKAIPVIAGAYVVVAGLWVFDVLSREADFGPRLTPNLLLLAVYMLIGYYLIRTQLANRKVVGGWSVSGVALSIVFPTCGIMHAVFAVYATNGLYDADWHGVLIDWLAVPAAIYFVWVVRSLYLGAISDWNTGAEGARPQQQLAMA